MLRLVFVIALALTLTARSNDRDDGALSDIAPDASADDFTFSDLVEGQSMVLTYDGEPLCVRFVDEWRHEMWEPDLMAWLPRDFADVSESDEPGSVGTLVFTWDPDGDDTIPDDGELVANLTFTSEIGGTFESVYSEGGEELTVVQGDFDIVEGHIDEAECEA